MQLGWHLHLADVVEERGELDVLPGARREAEPLPDRDHELDDVAAVAARVRVVRLDHLAEQHRGAAIRVRELERVVEAPLPLLGEHLEQEDEREHDGNTTPDCPTVRHRDDEPDRGERDVDECRLAHRQRAAHGRDSVRPGARPGARSATKSAAELCARARRRTRERRATSASRGSGEREDDCRSERIRRVRDDDRRTGSRGTARARSRRLAEEIAGGDEERDVPRRQREEHRHETSCVGERAAVPTSKLDAGDERVREHGDERRRRERTPRERKERSGRRRRRDEERRLRAR